MSAEYPPTIVSRTLTVKMTIDSLGGVTLDFFEPESNEESRLELWGAALCNDNAGLAHRERERVGAEIGAYVLDMYESKMEQALRERHR